ncbi:NUDIX hydrolase [archaeon]|nr:NUDIX hydrolase [archaeon]MBT7567899.1 NUDIX hydrolase [archaeon]
MNTNTPTSPNPLNTNTPTSPKSSRTNNPLNKKERENIFEIFIKNKKMKFTEIEKMLDIRSNLLNYHLKIMIEEGLLGKEEEMYCLTKEGEKIIPFYAHLTNKEKGSLVICAVAIRRRGEICLLKRNKRPYQGYWGMIGGKVRLEESIEETAVREALEETGLTCKFKKVASVLHERVKDSGTVKHSFIIFLCEVEAETDDLVETEEGEVKWFPINTLPENIIPSDRLMIEKLLKTRKSNIGKVMIEEVEDELKNLEYEEYGKRL